MRLAVGPLLAIALPGLAAAETARYELTVNIGWSEATHPHEWPADDPHMSQLTGLTHNSRYVLFADGRTASGGLKSIAENGRSGIITAELDDLNRKKKRTGDAFTAEGLATVPGTMRTTFTVSDEMPLVSFATMIAPSPDWITGLSSVDLMKDGAFVQELRLPLWAWDAGTDSGTTYTAENAETQPAQTTRLAASPHFLTAKGLVPVGEAILTLIAD